MDELKSPSLWSVAQPWVYGLIPTVSAGFGWIIRFLWVAERARRADAQAEAKKEDARRAADDEYRLRDRQQLSTEQTAAFARLIAERDRLAAEVERERADAETAWHAAYSIYDLAKDNRHEANSRLQQAANAVESANLKFDRLIADWTAGKPAPEGSSRALTVSPLPLPPVPPIETFGKPKE